MSRGSPPTGRGSPRYTQYPCCSSCCFSFTFAVLAVSAEAAADKLSLAPIKLLFSRIFDYFLSPDYFIPETKEIIYSAYPLI
jgi:hypothetical protein